MAETIRTHVSDGVQTVYPIDFTLGYLDNQAYVYVYTGADYTDQIAYTWVDDSSISITPPSNGTTFYIRRVIPRDKIVNNYSDGAIMREAEFDQSFLQAVMLFEEVADGFMSVVPPWVVNGDIDMAGNDILNLGSLQADQILDDLGNDILADTLAARDQAVDSAGAAATSESNAATSASTAAGEATTASIKAGEAATSATAAAGSASAANISEGNASTSAGNAATSESNAAGSASAASTSEGNASTSESNAATSASNASISESNASISESNAAASEASAEAWAESPTEPGGIGSKSAKTWAEEVATTVARENIPARNGALNQEAVDQTTGVRTGMSSTTYTGNGTSQSVDTGVDMATGDNGGLVWVKPRGNVGNHGLFDTVRGVGNFLASSTTGQEVFGATYLTAFNSDGFTLGSEGTWNGSGQTKVAWSFQTNQKIAPVYGSELVGNGDFPVNTTNWTAGASATLAVDTARLKVTNGAAAYGYAYQQVTGLTIGESYTVSVDFTYVNNGVVNVGTTENGTQYFGSGTLTANDAIKVTFVATTTSAYITLGNATNVASNNCIFDNVTLKEVTNSVKTNRGKPYTAHYNADMGFSIVGYEGDGVAGHEIPHHLGVEPELSITKDRGNARPWNVQSPMFGLTEFLELNSTAALTASANFDALFSDTTISLGSNDRKNGSTGNYIQYNFASKPGVSKIGKYIGTGAAGNYVDCGFKVGWLMVKNLTTAQNWQLVDAARGLDTTISFIKPNASDAEGVAASTISRNETGFVLLDGDGQFNTLNDEYLFLTFADSGSGDTTYEYPLTDDQLAIRANTLLSFAEGFNAQGQVDTQEYTTSTTVNLGAGFENQHLWMYKDKAGNYGFSEYRPLVGETRNAADKWGVVSPVDASLRTTAKHFDYESATGVASASSENAATGYEAWRAFNKIENDIVDNNSQWTTLAATATGWLQYKHDEKRILKSYRIRQNDDTQRPKRFTIEGSNDGLNWTAVDSSYGASDYTGNGAGLWGDLQDISGNTTAYLYHRIDVTANNGGTILTIAELEFNTILPADYYLVPEGKMYEYLGTNLTTNSDFATDISGYNFGANVTPTWDAGTLKLVATNTFGFEASQTVTGLVAGEKYLVTIDYTQGAGNTSAQLVAGGVISTGTTSRTLGVEFVATGTSELIYWYGQQNGGTTNWDNFTVKHLGSEIDRIYLAEVRTGGSGDVTYLRNLTAAKQDFTEVEVQGDLKVHGEIESRQVFDTWVEFSGSVNPISIRQSKGIADVVDLGTGEYKVLFEEPAKNLGYGAFATCANALTVGVETNRGVEGFTVYVRDDDLGNPANAGSVTVGTVGSHTNIGGSE